MKIPQRLTAYCDFCRRQCQVKDIRPKREIGRDKEGKRIFQNLPVLCDQCKGAKLERYTSNKHVIREHEVDLVVEKYFGEENQ